MSEPLTPAGQPDHGPPDPIRPVHFHDTPGLTRCAWPGCPYPQLSDGYPAFQVVNGLDYCHLHATAAIEGQKINDTFKPLLGTGEP